MWILVFAYMIGEVGYNPRVDVQQGAKMYPTEAACLSAAERMRDSNDQKGISPSTYRIRCWRVKL